ncbi:calcium-dependent protein phosphatase, putative [Babesia caballi]|uniref:protein-serine/threonine phosphatase n=1 Tax=Babesia caballi TaxID=5871 RepID=A0AAV4LMH2_BABCB|nr:calcium-dependent protein phosphatase, putative [Babesia caballi]
MELDDVPSDGAPYHGDSDAFAGALVPIESAPTYDFEASAASEAQDALHIPSMSEGYTSGPAEGSVNGGSSGCASKATFMRWQSQGNLLMEMVRDDARMRREARAVFDSSSCSSSVCEGDFGSQRQGESSDRDMDDTMPYLHALFFTAESQLHRSNNEVVSFLLKTFRDLDETKLISAPFELSVSIEAFRGRIFDVMGREFNSVTIAEALLTVAFNHYGGVEHPGYMTLGEYLSMMQVYKNVFPNDTMTRFVFDSMDRRRRHMISLNDFIGGMMACSPQAAHKVNSASGRLRLQHIFRAYDVKRKGRLSPEALRVMLGHIQLLGRIASSDKVEHLPSLTVSFSSIHTSESLTDMEAQGSERTPDEMVEMIMSAHEGRLGYDAFYSCVESGLIKGTHLLLRSDKDFAEMIGQHLIHALSHVVVPAEVALPSPVEVASTRQGATPDQGDQPDLADQSASPRAPDRTRKPSLWSTGNSPASPDRRTTSLSPGNGSGFVDMSMPASAREPYNFGGPSPSRKPLFNPGPAKGGSLDNMNRLTNTAPLFRNVASYKVAGQHYSDEADYVFRSSRARLLSSRGGYAAAVSRGRWSARQDRTVSEFTLQPAGYPQLRPFESDVNDQINSEGLRCETYRRDYAWDRVSSIDLQGELGAVRKRADTDGVVGVNRNTDYLGFRGVGLSYFGNDSAETIHVPELALPSRAGISEVASVDTAVNAVEAMRPDEARHAVPDLCASGESSPVSDNSNSSDSETPSGSGASPSANLDYSATEADHELERILLRRMADLCRRYRARFIGFNSRMLSDYGVPLKIFGAIYQRCFKTTAFQRAFERFDWCSYNELLELCDIMCSVLKQEGTVVHLQGTAQLHGPLNGNVFLLLESFNVLGWPIHGDRGDPGVTTLTDKGCYAKGEAVKLVFLGDMIGDSAAYSLETLLVLFSMKVLFPYHVFLLRGRREARHRDYKSALFREISAKLAKNAKLLKLEEDDALLVQSAHELYHRICNVFEHLSLAACVDGNTLCLHGAPSKAFRSLNQLARIPKPLAASQHTKSGAELPSAYSNVHARNALFGTLSSAEAEGHDEHFAVPFTHDELTYCMNRAEVALLVTSGSLSDRGFSNGYDDRLLQLGGCTPGGVYSVALIKQHRTMHYFIKHRSLRVP